MIIKNSNLRQILFSNRYKILGIIIAIILVLCLIQVANELTKQKMKDRSEELANTPIIDSTYNPSETVISGKDVPKEQQTANSNIISSFIKYCNNKEIEKAYDILTNECKEKIFFSKIEYFNKNYVEKIFNTKKSYTIQSWETNNGYTYKVELSEDIMSTGKISENKIEEYYTVVMQDNEYKLNIGGYIGKNNSNAYSEAEGIRIEILNKDIYKDYEEYKIKVKNNTKTTIMLDSKQNTSSVYLQGQNDKPYSAFMYEIDENRLIVKPGYYTTLSIRFNKLSTTSIKMRYMVFTDIIKDYDEYKQLNNKKEYKNRLNIKIEL